MNEEAKNPHPAVKKIDFFFEGNRLTGNEGEPIAKALFAAGVTTLSHSPKYHRPRGVHCARGRCSMCHMEVNGVPGVPTCTTPLREGMRVGREGFQPFYAPLLTAGLNTVSLPAGFYYRMFTRPTFMKNLFMKRLRTMAGVGRITLDPHEPLPRQPDSMLASLKAGYDAVVVGAGVSGMSAALAAGDTGARVLLVDEYRIPGGHALGRQRDSNFATERDALVDRIRKSDAITRCFNATAYGFYPPGTILLGDRTGMRRVKAASFIFATGAYDLIPLFENNDTPGIFGERGIRLLLERDDFVPGTRAVVYGTGGRLDDLTALLQHREIEIAGVVDPGRDESGGGTTIKRMKRLSLAGVRGGRWLTEAHFSEGGGGGVQVTLPCDMLIIAFAGQPAYELPYQAGFKFSLSDDALDENRVLLPAATSFFEGGVGFHLVGEAAGTGAWRRKIEQGRDAGSAARSGRSPAGEVED
jgi:sarcosine oxidase subunit alpha